jgi:hypothetical protein
MKFRKISLLHASRGRYEQALAARRLWYSRAYDPANIEYLFSVDYDDDTVPYGTKPFDSRDEYTVRNYCENGGCVKAWNCVANACNGDILIQMSDDWTPQQDWDILIQERLPEGEHVLAVSDGHRTDKLLCMAILTRARLNAQGGYLFNPAFKSVYSDDWFTHCAYRDGVVIEARDLVFKHNNPFFTTGNFDSDETYRRSNSPERYAEGKAIFERLKRENPNY